MGLLITFLLGVFVLIGAAIAGLAKNESRARELSVAVAAGAIAVLLVGDLLPEAIEGAETIGVGFSILAAAIGFGILVLLDRFLPEAPANESIEEHSHGSAFHVSVSTTIALALHNIIEGMSVASLAAQSVSTAMLLAFGVGIHNIPMGMIVFAGVRDRNMGKRVAILGTAALSTLVGGVIVTALGSNVNGAVIAFVLALTIGLLAYILVIELIPHLIHTEHPKLAILGVVVGAVVVALGVFVAGMVE